MWNLFAFDKSVLDICSKIGIPISISKLRKRQLFGYLTRINFLDGGVNQLIAYYVPRGLLLCEFEMSIGRNVYLIVWGWCHVFLPVGTSKFPKLRPNWKRPGSSIVFLTLDFKAGYTKSFVYSFRHAEIWFGGWILTLW